MESTCLCEFVYCFSEAGFFWEVLALRGLTKCPSLAEGSDFLAPCAAIVQNFDTLFHPHVDPVSVETVLRQKQFGIAVSDQPVGYAHAHNVNFVLQTVLLEQFQDGRTKPAGYIGFFDRNQKTSAAGQRQEQLGIEWLYKPSIDDRCFDPFLGEILGRFQ